MTVNIHGIGKITASKNVLNLLSIYAKEAGGHYESKDYNALAEQAYEAAKAIYDALKETSYYEN